MKKSIKYTILLLLSLLFIISCNDSDLGLIQNAMTDKYEEQYNVYEIVGRDDKYLYLATNKGIYSFSESGSFNYICSNGNEAKYDILYCDGKSLVKRIPENKYLIYDLSSNESDADEIVALNGKEFIGLYSPDGITFTYLFREKDDKGIITGYYAWSGEVKDSTTFLDSTFKLNKLNETDDPDRAYETTIIGTNAYRRKISNEEYIYTHADNSKYKFTIKDGDNTKEETTSKTKFIGINEDIYVRADGNFTTTGSTEYSTFKGMSSSEFVPVSNGDSPIYIYPGSNSYVSTSEKAEKNVNGLSLVTPHSIIKHESENKYLIMTLKHGAFVLDGTNMKSIKETSGVNFSDYTYNN